MNMVKVKALRGFGIGGGTFASPGEVVNLQEVDARLRIWQGKAIIYNEAEKIQTVSTEIHDKGGKKK